MKNKVIIFVSGVLIVLGSFYFLYPAQISYEKKEVMLGDVLYTLEVSDTDTLRQRGLSYREILHPNTGMLFIFDIPGIYSFWMKDMNFPIDIIWLDAKKRVVHIEHTLSPTTYPKSFGPNLSIQYVIEIPAGKAKETGIILGNTLDF